MTKTITKYGMTLVVLAAFVGDVAHAGCVEVNDKRGEKVNQERKDGPELDKDKKESSDKHDSKEGS